MVESHPASIFCHCYYHRVSEEALDKAEEKFKCRIPPTLRMLWRVHNGQTKTFPGHGFFFGIFGRCDIYPIGILLLYTYMFIPTSYAFYNHISTMFMMPVEMGFADDGVLRLARSPASHRAILVDANTDRPFTQNAAGEHVWMYPLTEESSSSSQGTHTLPHTAHVYE